MNERIDELAQGCYEYIEGTLDGMLWSFDYKKFAELIVRECLEVLDLEPYESDREVYQQAIKKYFGVKE